MLKELRIQGFRCYEDVALTDLKRINLFVGRNNVGKTSLLEGLFLLAGHFNPEVAFRLNLYRGIAYKVFNPEEIWGWLFKSRDMDTNFNVTAVTETNHAYSVKVALEETTKTEVSPLDSSREAVSDKGHLSFEHTRARRLIVDLLVDNVPTAHGESWVARNKEGKDSLVCEQTQRLLGEVVFLPAFGYPGENVERFSKLQEVGRESEVVRALQIVEPRLTKLILQIFGGLTTVAADVGMGRVVPAQYLGGGTLRLLSYVLAISSCDHGIILIDEFENGLHYSVLKDVWKSVAEASRQSQTQIFATTHSLECIRAAHEAFQETDDHDFSLHRLDRHGDAVTSVAYDEETLGASFEFEFEVR